MRLWSRRSITSASCFALLAILAAAGPRAFSAQEPEAVLRKARQIHERRKGARALEVEVHPEAEAAHLLRRAKFLADYVAFRSEKLNFKGLSPHILRQESRVRRSADGARQASVLLSLGERRLWADWIVPRERAKVEHIERSSLLAQLDGQMIDARDYREGLRDDEGLEPGQARYLQIREIFTRKELREQFGSEFETLLNENELLVPGPVAGSNWSEGYPEEDHPFAVQLGATRAVMGYRVDPDTLKTTPLPLPHLPPERRAKLVTALGHEPELLIEFGRAHYLADGVSEPELTFLSWACAREAAWLGKDIERVRIVVRTRGWPRAKHYRDHFGFDEPFDKDLSGAMPIYWMSMSLGDLLRKYRPERIVLGGKEMISAAPERNPLKLAEDLADLKRRTRTMFRLRGPVPSGSLELKVRQVERSLEREVRSALEARSPSPHRLDENARELAYFFKERESWGETNSPTYEIYRADELGIGALATSDKLDELVFAGGATDAELARLLLKIRDTAQASIRGPIGRFGVLLRVFDPTGQSRVHAESVRRLERLARDFGLTLPETGNGIAYQRFLIIDEAAAQGLRHWLAGHPDPWTVLPSQQELRDIEEWPWMI